MQTVVLQRSVMAKPTKRKANTRNVTPLNTRRSVTAQRSTDTNSRHKRNIRRMEPQFMCGTENKQVVKCTSNATDQTEARYRLEHRRQSPTRKTVRYALGSLCKGLFQRGMSVQPPPTTKLMENFRWIKGLNPMMAKNWQQCGASSSKLHVTRG